MSLPGAAQERGFELGTRLWLSSGENRFAHNAQGADPTLGNPTSILAYDDLDARAAELHWRTNFAERWFFKGNFGVGEVRDGSFDDEDFNAGQVKFSDTTSEVRGERFSYLTLDLGRDFWTSAAGSHLGVFAGFQQWSEQVDAFGAMATVGPISIPPDVRVITNDVRWRSLRAGVAGRAAVTSRIRVLADLAYVPYAQLRNDDSHYLRADLGPVPDVITSGRGSGVQLDLELRFALHQRLEAGVGVRHWRLTMDRADVTLAGVTVPVTEFETRRPGITATVVGRWIGA
ncbi:MAG: hypothetical protein ACT4P3_13395 [Betaproteobacteria bacterium]